MMPISKDVKNQDLVEQCVFQSIPDWTDGHQDLTHPSQSLRLHNSPCLQPTLLQKEAVPPGVGEGNALN